PNHKPAFGGVHLDTPTIAEVSCSLSLRGTSGERAGGEGLVPSNCRALLNPLSLNPLPTLRRGERESAAGMVVVLRCTPFGANWKNRIAMLFCSANHERVGQIHFYLWPDYRSDRAAALVGIRQRLAGPT